MFVSEAAVRIRCTPAWVRALIKQGKLKATKVKSTWGFSRRTGYYWDVDPISVNAYRRRKIRYGRPRIGANGNESS